MRQSLGSIMGLSAEEELLEEEHLRKVLRVLRHDYLSTCTQRLGKLYHDAPSDCATLCPEYLTRLARIGDALTINQNALRTLTKSYSEMDDIEGEVEERGLFVENCKSLLRQLVREWAVDGEEERAVYKWIIEKTRKYGDSECRVLVPGAGLGRLSWELAKCGFAVQGSEFSNFMLLPSECILNHLDHQITIHPYLFPFSNTKSEADQLKAISIPDILPSAHSADIHDFSMVAGDFIQVYKQDEYRECFSIVASCFFLDTAKNIIEYLQLIKKILKPNGLLINCGPLLYHFEGSVEEPSVELTLAELRLVMQRVGFVLVEETTLETTYVQNHQSMLTSVYECNASVWRRAI